MATPLRQFQLDMPYHIYNRGNRKNSIFLDTKDYLRFIRRLKEYKDRFEIELLCYCLMSNHFHLLLKSRKEDAITKFMLTLCTSYSKYFNIKHELVGRLFQERFRAKLVETDEYLLHLSRYIHLNPISEDIEKLNFSPRSTPGVELSRLKEYPWSSYNEYCNKTKGLCDKDQILSYFSETNPADSYKSFVEDGINKNEREIISAFL
ncbi:transposase [Candidatus Gottesmanbacteria bacterium]|nr:transposase [Candidatus Gottesmanbacteria bacterium]